MASLADRVIEANNENQYRKEQGLEERITEQEIEYEIDDLGFRVEKNIQKNPRLFTEYVKFRCRFINPELYKDCGMLWNGHTQVLPKLEDIALLSNMPSGITNAIAKIVYDALMREVPTLDRTKIYIAGDTVWDTTTATLVSIDRLKDKYVTIGKGEKNGYQGHTAGDAVSRYNGAINNADWHRVLSTIRRHKRYNGDN